MTKRLWFKIGLAVLAILLFVVGAGILWVRSSLWDQIESIAREQGVRLEKPAMDLAWLGGYRFHLRFENVRGEATLPLRVQGPFSIAVADAVFELQDGFKKIQFEELIIERVGADLKLSPTAADGSADEAVVTQNFELPELAIPEFRRPDLPMAVTISAFRLGLEGFQFALLGDSALQASVPTLNLSGSAELNSQKTDVDLKLEASGIDVVSTAPVSRFAVQKVGLTVNVEVRGSTTDPLLVGISTSGKIDWQAFRFLNPATDATAKDFKISDEGGEFHFVVQPPKVQLDLKGRKLSSSAQNSATDYSMQLAPNTAKAGKTAFDFSLLVPKLLELKLQVLTNSVIDLKSPEASVKGSVGIHPDLSLLVLDKNPFPWKEMIRGPIEAGLRGNGLMTLKTKLQSKGFLFDLNANLNSKTQDGEASGFASIDFRGQNLSFAGMTPSGRVSLPFKFLLRQKRQFFFESELRFQDFDVKSKDMKITSVQGSLPVKQSWLFEAGVWLLSPRLTPNAFARVDFDSFEPLDTRSNLLRINRIEASQRVYGPVTMDLKFDQNIFRSGAWSARVGQGQIEGALQIDMSVDHPRLGLLLRAFDVKMHELLPDTMFRSKIHSDKGLSFRLGMDWDLANATAVGRLDWSSITSEQVMQVVDYFDPQFEDATFNQARMVLAQAYPTRVQVEMRGPVADVRIQTNLVRLPEIRNLALSPYLTKFSEPLFTSELYRNLRPTSTTKVIKSSRRKEP